MGVLFLINAFIVLLVLIFLIKGFFKYYKNEQTKKTIRWFFLLGLGYLTILIFSVAWFLDLLTYSSNDFVLIFSLIVFVQTLFLFRSMSFLKINKKIFYLFLFYFIGVISVFLSLSYAALVFLIISFLMTLILAFSFLSGPDSYRIMGQVLVLYSAVSLIMTFLLFFEIGDAFFYNIVSNVIFLAFVFLFIRDLEKYPVTLEKVKEKEDSHALLFVKYFIFIIVVANFVLISTVSVHELSHVVASRFYDCDSRAIFYEEGFYPYSEILCDDLSGKVLIALSGPLVPIIIGLILLLIGGRFIRPISYLIIGFNLLASFKDFRDVGLSDNIIFGSSILGLILLFLGIALLARSRMHEHAVLALKEVEEESK